MRARMDETPFLGSAAHRLAAPLSVLASQIPCARRPIHVPSSRPTLGAASTCGGESGIIDLSTTETGSGASGGGHVGA